MARITDKTKIDRLKLATMKLVVERGFGGASVALIANEAGIASGYFYRHYKGKYELVNTILQEVYQEVFAEFDDLLKQGFVFNVVIEKIVRHFVQIANNEPLKVKYLYVLTNDYSFLIDEQLRSNVFLKIEKLKELGQATHLLDEHISEDDLYLILFVHTIQFINQRYKKTKQKVSITNADVEHLLYLFNKFLK